MKLGKGIKNFNDFIGRDLHLFSRFRKIELKEQMRAAEDSMHILVF